MNLGLSLKTKPRKPLYHIGIYYDNIMIYWDDQSQNNLEKKQGTLW